MSALATKIYEEAESLPPIERIQLVERLLFSLDSRAERERIDKLWGEEAEDRLASYERGEMKSIPAEVLFHRLEAGRK